MTLAEELEVLSALVLKWAKESEPEKYAETLRVSATPKTFRAYLIRLLEIRWEADKGEWRGDVQLWMLEETGIRQKLNWRGTEIEVCGKKVQDRTWAFAELAMCVGDPERFAELLEAKKVLDLQVVSVERK